jgi:hypothetical protein
MEFERRAGRTPEDVHPKGAPDDVSSPPRKIEVKASGGSARGVAIPLERPPGPSGAPRPGELLPLYVVDNVARVDDGLMRVRVIHGGALEKMLARTKPR